jgi:asparagine synthase (glutamine-hydrolysing)
MCGILAIFNSSNINKHNILKSSKTMRHRGPDASGILHGKDWAIAHERLAIVDPKSGSQPFQTDNNTILAVNGEIYNHYDLKTGSEKTKSDCEVIATRYDLDTPSNALLHSLDGVYAFVLYNKKTKSILVARDRIGVMPLYYGYGYDGSIAFASEMKALQGLVGCVNIFPPGHKYEGKTIEPIPDLAITCNISTTHLPVEEYYSGIEHRLFEATKKRIMSDVPWGVLLSGGLDSSIIGHLANKVSDQPLKTFCIGLEGSQDAKAANDMAESLGSDHTNFTFTKEEGWDAIADVIYHLETYDVTTIRAGTPMFLLARKIRSMGIKMVLSGEGSDELFAGYLYFHNAPNAKALQQECYDKVKALHQYDCLRANKAMAAFGIECRVPFLDMGFVDYVMNEIPPEHKMVQNGVEKHLLRSSFETSSMPKTILNRQKEQFSDGVGYGWIDFIKEKTSCYDSILKKVHHFFPTNTPKTSEAFYYRMLFDKIFSVPGSVETVPYEDSCACSTGAAALWKGNEINDASGRSVNVHKKAV